MTSHIPSRLPVDKRFVSVALAAILLVLAALTVGTKSASANSYQWGDNGSGACNAWSSANNLSAELGTYCMQSVTGWISIGEAASQSQAISCANNAPGGSPGLSWSTDGQAYVNDGPWYELAYLTGNQDGAPKGGDGIFFYPAWQTGNGGDADLSSEPWLDSVDVGSQANAQYGVGGAAVSNFGGSGGWQAAIACTNMGAPNAMKLFTNRSLDRGAGVRAAPVRIRDKTLDSVSKAKGKAFLAREYALKMNVTRTDTRTCPAGMVRKGKLSHTVQEFPANNKYSWKNRSLVDVKMTAKGKNAASVTMTLTRAKNPTVVQFQLRCGKP